MGLLEEYLKENCGTNRYRMCAYKDSIPWDLMWDFNGPLYKTGGWDANRGEYNQIIRDMLTTPKYGKRFAARAMEGTFRQFFTFDVDVPPQLTQGSPAYTAIYVHWNENNREYLSSRQSMKLFEVSSLNTFQRYFMALCLFLSVAVFFVPGFPGKFRWLILWIVLSIFVNALVCSVFAGVVPRYQDRVVWLLPLPLMIFLSQTTYFGRVNFRKSGDPEPS
jgi:hypothetical protein